MSYDSFLKEMSIPMYEKFDKYWGEIGVLMCIASILDPRYKKLSIEWTFDKLYVGDECLKRVEDVETKLESLFKKYHNTFMASKASMSHSNISTSSNEPTQDVDDFHAFLKCRPVETGKKTELEVYMDEPNDECVDDSKYDVLKWWSQHCSKFPVLSRMAKDIFSIPITTVASESAFSAGGRILDDYRSSLSKDMVELLVCGSDWLKSGSKATIKTLKQCADEEENLEIEVLIPDGCDLTARVTVAEKQANEAVEARDALTSLFNQLEANREWMRSQGIAHVSISCLCIKCLIRDDLIFLVVQIVQSIMEAPETATGLDLVKQRAQDAGFKAGYSRCIGHINVLSKGGYTEERSEFRDVDTEALLDAAVASFYDTSLSCVEKLDECLEVADYVDRLRMLYADAEEEDTAGDGQGGAGTSGTK
ncbi:putative HAT dimerization domain, ribonuclease H-like superfamily, hAT-like transposase, RNase-H [Helianthus anomalus]